MKNPESAKHPQNKIRRKPFQNGVSGLAEGTMGQSRKRLAAMGSEMQYSYGRDGHLCLWKELSEANFGGRINRRMADLMLGHLSQNPKNRLRILSPTANTANIEADIFDKLKNEFEVHLIAGDITSVEPDRRIKNRDGMSYLRLNALELPFKDSCLDVIFDKKGLLWHAARKTFGEGTDLITPVLQEYFRALAKGGAAIIDSIEEGYSHSVVDGEAFQSGKIEFKPGHISVGECLQTEPSTLRLIELCMAKYPEIQANYKFETLGDEPHLLTVIRKIK